MDPDSAKMADVIMSADDWIRTFAIGIVAGAVGQLIRSLAGLVRLQREQLTGVRNEDYNRTTLMVSLLIGAGAGAVASILLRADLLGPNVTLQTILGLMAAGYAGADFIEGVFGKFRPWNTALGTAIRPEENSRGTSPSPSSPPPPAAAPASPPANSISVAGSPGIVSPPVYDPSLANNAQAQYTRSQASQPRQQSEVAASNGESRLAQDPRYEEDAVG